MRNMMHTAIHLISFLKKPALVLGLMLALTGCKEVLQKELSARDATEMAILLADAGIDVERRTDAEGNYEIWVDEAQSLRALDLLTRAGLPKQKYQSMAEVFPGGGFIITPLEQQARFIHALNQELSQTISNIEGIASARVHVVTPDQSGSARTRTKSSASVTIHHLASVDSNTLMDRVRIIVANAVPDLAYRDVSVAFFAVEDPMKEDMSPALAAAHFADPSQAVRAQAGVFSMRSGIIFFGFSLLGAGAWMLYRMRTDMKV
jgi:type III secretion protein J